MKIKYQFSTETVTLEVEDQWATVLVDLDRQEYNVNQKETRRHCSLEAYNLDDALLPSDMDVEAGVIADADKERLYATIAELQPQQQELLKRVHFQGEKMADIARADGVSKAALTARMKKIYKSLQKKLSRGD